MNKRKKLIIFGLEDFAQIVYEYFTHDSDYEVVAFSANRDYISKDKLMNLPIIPFEEIEKIYSNEDHYIYVAVTYGKLNDVRELVCAQAKNKGYKLASYVSSKSFIWRNVDLGEHVFIFENNVIQPFVKIGDNVVLWSGNHIGHHSKISNNCFVSSHVVVSGWCDIGENCFIGVNTTIANNVKIGNRCWISHASVVSKNIPESSITKSISSDVSDLNEALLFKALSRISKNRNAPSSNI